jgi:hypothetical protein
MFFSSETPSCAARAGRKSSSMSSSRCGLLRSTCKFPRHSSLPHQGLDFTKLAEKRIDPPFVPSLSKGYQDISMFEDATAVDISISRPTSRLLKEPGSPDVAQIQGFNFQAKTYQILSESAKKSRPFVDDSSRAPRVPASEVPVFTNMRRSKSSESLDTAAKHAMPGGSPAIEPAQAPSQPAPIAIAPEPDKSKSSPTVPNPGRVSPVPLVAAAAAATAVAKPTPLDLAAQFFASCGWESKAAAAHLIEALADPRNPQLSDKKFQHAAAIFSNEVTSAIL